VSPPPPPKCGSCFPVYNGGRTWVSGLITGGMGGRGGCVYMWASGATAFGPFKQAYYLVNINIGELLLRDSNNGHRRKYGFKPVFIPAGNFSTRKKVH
jgi:hypothetical protein